MQKGYVYSFRTHRKKLGKDWATRERCGKKVCDIRISNEVEITDWFQLGSYVKGSGFANVLDWVCEILRLARLKDWGPNMRGWLYLMAKVGSK